MKLEQATQIAEEIKSELAIFCERIEIAGSVRRRKPEVHDIEIIAVPKFRPVNNLFGEAVIQTSELDIYLNGLEWERTRNGNKFKQFVLPQGINLDLFLVTPPAHWGVLFVIRTGPADFSKWIVTQRGKGGCLPSDCYVVDGAVIQGAERVAVAWTGDSWPVKYEYRGGHVVDMPEEIDFLNLLGLGWIEPWERKPGILPRRL